MTAAIFGLVGVVVGSVLTALLNYWLQRRADERRWDREDQLRFHAERLRLYRDFSVEAAKAYGEFDLEKFTTQLHEIDLIGAPKVAKAARSLWIYASGVGLEYEMKEAGEEFSQDLGRIEMNFTTTNLAFTEAAREELGLPPSTDRREFPLL